MSNFVVANHPVSSNTSWFGVKISRQMCAAVSVFWGDNVSTLKRRLKPAKWLPKNSTDFIPFQAWSLLFQAVANDERWTINVGLLWVISKFCAQITRKKCVRRSGAVGKMQLVNWSPMRCHAAVRSTDAPAVMWCAVGMRDKQDQFASATK